MKRKITIKSPILIILLGVFLFFFILVKLVIVSLSSKVDNINLKEFANNRNTKTETIYAHRGNIYDKDGNILATTVNSYKLIAYLDPKRTTNPKKPYHVVDKEGTAKKLSELLPNMTYEYALQILNKEGAYQVEFGTAGKNISEADKNKIEALKLPGIDFISGVKRTYSMGTFASYIVGYAKVHEDGDIVGELGIESFYDKDLSGTDGSRKYQTDAYGYTLPSAEVITEDAIDGDNIYLTIDSNIQLFAENLVKNLKDNYEMDWMIFTVMDAKTGAIVASSTYPNFDPNKLGTIKDYKNPLVSYQYEPGSPMKTFSFATAINEGKYNGSDTYKSGQIEVADSIIRDFNKTGWGVISYDTGYAYSSNVAATKLALNIGSDTLSDYYGKLGFGNKTGIELANELDGKINIKYKTELATASFGQGITVTPIQMLQALSCITNDGTTLKPYVVSKIVDNNGNIKYSGERTELNKVYSKETTDYIKKLMHNVVYDGLKSSEIWQPSKTTMMGKTGTAQIASSKGGYQNGPYDYIRSFVGIFPEEDPKYIIYVAVQKLTANSARPIAKEVTEAVDKIVSYIGLENTKTDDKKKTITLDNYISKEINKTKELLSNNNLKVYVLGTGKYIINQYPLKSAKVLENSKVFLVSNNKDYIMEDVTGWSMGEVQEYANLLGIELKTNHYGYVVSQNIAPGTEITSDMVLELELRE